MAAPLNSLSFFLVFSFLLSRLTLSSTSFPSPQCKTFSYSTCSDSLFLSYPYTYSPDPKCGIFHVNCSNDGRGNHFEAGGRRYIIKAVLPEDRALVIQDFRSADFCDDHHQNLILPNSHLVSFELKSESYTFLKCNRSQSNIITGNYSESMFTYTGCNSSVLYYWQEKPAEIPYHKNCSLFTYPIYEFSVAAYGWKNLSHLLSSGFVVEWHLTPECADCFGKMGICDWNHTGGSFMCLHPGNQMCSFS